MPENEDRAREIVRHCLGVGDDSITPEASCVKMEDMARKGRPPMKEDADFRKHNQQAYAVASGELRQFIEQFEHLEAEKKDITEQQKDIMSEAKARGYDTKVMKKIIAMRKRDKNDLAKEDAIMDIYKAALGMV